MKRYVLLLSVDPFAAERMTQELQAIFKSKHPEFTIVNHKVLKDENGLSRGVGFAR